MWWSRRGSYSLLRARFEMSLGKAERYHVMQQIQKVGGWVDRVIKTLTLERLWLPSPLSAGP